MSVTPTPGMSTALLRSRCTSSFMGKALDSKYLASGQARTVVPCLRSPSPRGAHHQRLHHIARRERQTSHLAFAITRDFQAGGQSVGHGHTDGRGKPPEKL